MVAVVEDAAVAEIPVDEAEVAAVVVGGGDVEEDSRALDAERDSEAAKLCDFDDSRDLCLGEDAPDEVICSDYDLKNASNDC